MLTHQLEVHITKAMERLELLIPDVTRHTSRNLQEYALAYTERYQGDMLRLEHEWDFLSTALLEAWRHERFTIVAQLATALAYPTGRHTSLPEARSLLQMGIAASRRTRDQERLAALLSRLGNLLFTHGKYQQGWRLWNTALHFTDSLAGIWEPFLSFVQIADILGNFSAIQQFVEVILSKQQAEYSESLAVALFIRGFHARWQNDLDRAAADLHHCLQILFAQTPAVLLSPAYQLFSVSAQTELARLQGQYTRAQIYAETAISLAQTFSDRYTFATLLIDQGVYAHLQGQYADLHTTYQRLKKMESSISTPHILECIRLFKQYLEAQNYPLYQPDCLPPPTPISSRQGHPLSKREVEILTLVAEGLSNAEIAQKLVITRATAKKHLEHIYTRLDVHSRTGALAQARLLGILP